MLRGLLGAVCVLTLSFVSSGALANTYFLQKDLGIQGTQHLCQYSNNRVYAVSVGQICAPQIEDQPNMATQSSTGLQQGIQSLLDSTKPPSELEEAQTRGQQLQNAKSEVELARMSHDAAMNAKMDQDKQNRRNVAMLSQILNRDVSTSLNLTGSGDVLCAVDEIDKLGLVQGETRKLKLHFGEDGSISLPTGMLPPIKAGGQNGTWPLFETHVTDMEITTMYKLNVFNRPKVHIDRLTGHVTINGLKHFVGQCAATS